MKSFFVVTARLDAPGTPDEIATEVIERVHWGAHVRGLHAEDLYDLPPTSPSRLGLVVVGEQDTDVPGWDADGAPVETWPAAALPWGSPVGLGGDA